MRNAVHAFHTIRAYHVVIMQAGHDVLANDLDTIHVIDIGRNDLACILEGEFRALIE